MIERRTAGRISVLRGVRVDFGGERGIFSALMRDMSDFGANLQLGGLIPPKHFDVFFDDFLTTRRCRRAWVKNGHVGIEFVGPLTRQRWPD